MGIIVASGRARPVGVHQLVADAFHGPCPTGQQVRHLDGNPTNNVPANLAYGTALDNAADRVRHGRYMSGAQHHAAKLGADDVVDLLKRRASGERVKVLAQRFGVSVSTVESIIYGKSYKAERSEFRRVP
ncbi:HNH endonuclease [Myxococcus phage Mx8]|uniref:p15 n=1 Tax=Myxococcus phage Mx8 TaxID=49964 RepID=Q94MV4_9CAUD|nr:HNH endonuclease [Myxococcus phage Mx8]AAK94350.1 p15 [Myxococcus phage Mx8]